MVQSGDVFEVFKEDCIVQVTAPEVIDPDNTNPKLPPNRKVLYSEIGSSNCIVARVFLQADKLCGDLVASNNIDKKEFLKILRECRDSLIHAYNTAFETSYEIMQLSNEYLSRASSSSACVVIPHIENLENRVHSFSTCVKRCLQKFGEIFNLIFNLKFTGHHYHKIRKFVCNEFGNDHPLFVVLDRSKDNIERLLKMRDAVEHPKASNQLVITNFSMHPQGALIKPFWQHLPNSENYDLAWEMGAIVDWMVEFIEVATLHIILTQTIWPHGFTVNSIAEENLDWECPFHVVVRPLFPADWPEPGSIK